MSAGGYTEVSSTANGKVSEPLETWRQEHALQVEAKYDIPKEGPRDQIKRMIAAGTKDHVAQSVFCQPIIRPVRTDAQDMLQYTRIKQKECPLACPESKRSKSLPVWHP